MPISKLKLRLPPLIVKKQFGAKLSSSSSCGHIRPQLLSYTKSIAYDVNHNKFSKDSRFAFAESAESREYVAERDSGFQHFKRCFSRPLEAKLDPVNHGVGGANRHKACPGRLLPVQVKPFTDPKSLNHRKCKRDIDLH